MVDAFAAKQECTWAQGKVSTSEVSPALSGGVRVPRSALLTFASDDVREAEKLVNSERRIELTLHRADASPLLLARARFSSSKDGITRVEWYPMPGPAMDHEVALTGLEALYAFLVRQDPLGRYVVAMAGKRSTSRQRSHADALLTISRWRECLTATLRSTRPSLRVAEWESASLRLHDGSPTALRVSASVRARNGEPVVGAAVAFMRGEHLACDGRTSATGIVSCELFDVHGHSDHHEEPGVPLSVTFAGVVHRDRIVLPTTLVVRPDRSRTAERHVHSKGGSDN